MDSTQSNAPGSRTPRRQGDDLDTHSLAPHCDHDVCVLEPECLIAQAELELADAIHDTEARRERTRVLAYMFGLGDEEARLFEVILYSSDIKARIRAGELLTEVLEEMAKARSAA